jgi:diguanylate cyclase (GGDEF)-like protein
MPLKRVTTWFSLRTQMLILLLGVAALIVGDRTREIIAERSRGVADAREDIFALARQGARREAELVSNARAILALASELPEVRGPTSDACREPFEQIIDAVAWLDAISVVDPRGNRICATESVRAGAHGISDRPYFQEVLASRDFVLSDILTSRLTNRPVVVAAMPKLAGDRVEAVLVAGIDVDWLSRVATAPSGLETADVLLLDGNGVVIAASSRLSHWVGRNVDDVPGFRRAIDSPDGVFRSSEFEGVGRIVAHMRLPSTGATLVVMRERAEVLAAVNARARYAMAKIVVTGLLCFLLVWLGGGQLVLAPLQRLADAAAQLGRGDRGVRVEPRWLAPELATVGKAFNAMAALLGEREEQLKRANEQLMELATTDALTGLANRRRFDERIDMEWRRAAQDGVPLALLICDVDNFKKFNDRYGHLEGDHCLRAVAVALKAAARRPGDLAARTGGEEFALILPGTSLAGAVAFAEKFRTSVEMLAIPHADNVTGRVTVSIGAASARPGCDEPVHNLVDAADAALYRAKRLGRNRVVRADAPFSLAS